MINCLSSLQNTTLKIEQHVPPKCWYAHTRLHFVNPEDHSMNLNEFSATMPHLSPKYFSLNRNFKQDCATMPSYLCIVFITCFIFFEFVTSVVWYEVTIVWCKSTYVEIYFLSKVLDSVQWVMGGIQFCTKNTAV